MVAEEAAVRAHYPECSSLPAVEQSAHRLAVILQEKDVAITDDTFDFGKIID